MDWRRVDRLHVKLFLAIAGVIAGLTLVSYLVFTWTFERGFVQYVNRADEARLELMTDRLAAGYAREGGWSWIVRDQARWTAMSRDALGLPASGEAGGRLLNCHAKQPTEGNILQTSSPTLFG